MKHRSADPHECLLRDLADILTRSGFRRVAPDGRAALRGSRQTAFVQGPVKVDIDPAGGPAVDVSAYDGLISARFIGWQAHFGPATPVEVITAAALAAQVVETRAAIVASLPRAS